MIVVADASVLVGELLRKQGRELLLDPDLRLLVAEHQWEETERAEWTITADANQRLCAALGRI